VPKLLRAPAHPRMPRKSRRSANWPIAAMLPATGSQESPHRFPQLGRFTHRKEIAEKLGCHPQTALGGGSTASTSKAQMDLEIISEPGASRE
jgi:hypothetical protein